MGKIYYSYPEECYEYVSDNGVVYDLYVGMTIVSEMKYSKSSDIIFIMLDDPEADSVEMIGWTYGAISLKDDREIVTEWIDDIVKPYEKRNVDKIKRLGNRPMPNELKQMLNKVCELSSCGYIRSYYDMEMHSHDDEYRYRDSAKVFNLFACLEEVTSALLDEDIEAAEKLIEVYAKRM